MLSDLNKLGKNYDYSSFGGKSTDPSISRQSTTTQSNKKKGKLMDRIEKANTKKEKREIINEWVLDEIKKINKNSELDDF